MDIKFKINCFNENDYPSEPKTIPLKIMRDDIIVKIKQKICIISKHACEKEKYFVLKFDGISLDDNSRLSSYNIRDGDTVIFDKANDIDPRNFVVINVSGNFNVPSVIQVEQNKSIRDLKEIITKYSKIPDFIIYKDGDELDENYVLINCNFIDDCKVYAVKRQQGVFEMNCLMQNHQILKIDYEITNKVVEIKKRVSDKYHYNVEDFVLFLDKEYLEDDRFLFEYKINVQKITYCHVTKLKVTLDNEPYTKGTFCDIYKARDDKSKEVIVKKYTCIKDEKFQRYKMLINELITFQIIKSNERFVQLLAFYKQDNSFFIAMEYIKSGSLDNYLKDHATVPDRTVASWAKQILEALDFLHQNFIIYRDLKPSNILLASAGIVKLGGFSLSKYLMGMTKNELKRGFVQTKMKNYRYMAPEVFNNEEYGIKIDVWSLGAILLEIITGNPPCHDMDDIGAAVQIARDRAIKYVLPPDTNELLAGFIASCLIGNPENRNTAEEMLKDKFLEYVGDDSQLVTASMECG